MQLKTILNRVERYKSFVYGDPRWADDARSTIEVPIRRAGQRPADLLGLRKAAAGLRSTGSRGVSSSCRCGRSPWCSCMPCGASIVRPAAWWSSTFPGPTGKSRLTTTYQWFLAGWARRLSWKEVASVFHTTWEHVRDSVRHAVAWGLVHRDLSGAEAIGVDEIQWRRGHHYLTLVYQIDDGLQATAVDRPRADRRLPAPRPGTAGRGRSARACGSCAATCGSRISRCSPNKPAEQSTFSIASTS